MLDRQPFALDIGLYFTLEHYSYFGVCVCARVRVRAGVSMRLGVVLLVQMGC